MDKFYITTAIDYTNGFETNCGEEDITRTKQASKETSLRRYEYLAKMLMKC